MSILFFVEQYIVVTQVVVYCTAALKLLGEKTTLLSPELVVASGIPCCRYAHFLFCKSVTER